MPGNSFECPVIDNEEVFSSSEAQVNRPCEIIDSTCHPSIKRFLDFPLHEITGSAMRAFRDMRAKELAALIEYIEHFSRRWKKKKAHGNALVIPKRPCRWNESGEKAILKEGNRLH
ncbi:MAG TPA: hypothetical protein DHV39_07070 [Verrucomicrobiales bacterium]|nr:hypothetical protein [Verrucomicrobiales bacterium]